MSLLVWNGIQKLVVVVFDLNHTVLSNYQNIYFYSLELQYTCITIIFLYVTLGLMCGIDNA
jgi:hypothetical protein